MYTSHFTMLFKYGKSMHEFLGHVYFYFSLVFYILGVIFNKTIIIPLMLAGYEMIMANLLLWALAAIYHLILFEHALLE